MPGDVHWFDAVLPVKRLKQLRTFFPTVFLKICSSLTTNSSLTLSVYHVDFCHFGVGNFFTVMILGFGDPSLRINDGGDSWFEISTSHRFNMIVS